MKNSDVYKTWSYELEFKIITNPVNLTKEA